VGELLRPSVHSAYVAPSTLRPHTHSEWGLSVRFSTLYSLVQVLHWNQRVLLSEYIKPHFPSDVYKYDMHHGDAAHKVAHEHDRTVAIWLEGVNPSIPTPIAMGVVDTQRYACLQSKARPDSLPAELHIAISSFAGTECLTGVSHWFSCSAALLFNLQAMAQLRSQS